MTAATASALWRSWSRSSPEQGVEQRAGAVDRAGREGHGHCSPRPGRVSLLVAS
ncbi:hypothetical protein ACU635_27510 [[Actinomadura] parvosata]|uniref:hypothetical protein n=1 Tax=[Actinomadura] parvosata TaxID=1955412 RepID=UPI00406BEDE4